MLTTSLAACTSHAAILSLENAEDGSSSMTLAPGESKDINVVLEIQAVDTGFAFCFLFLDDDGNDSDGVVDVTALVSGFEEGGSEMVVYDRSNFELPADISWNSSGGEYGLNMGRQDGSEWGPGIYILDTLTVTHNGGDIEATVNVIFEIDSHPSSARPPFIFAADYSIFAWGTGYAGIIANNADPGVGAEDGPFIIDLVLSEPDGDEDPKESSEGDVNQDGVVDSLDVGFVLSRFGCAVGTGDPYCDVADVNDDGLVDPLDSGFVLARFGEEE